jgi:hypothetical protein
MDSLTPALLETLSSRVAEARGEVRPRNEPSDDELMETIAEMLERMLTPREGANLEAGKAAMRQTLEQVQAHFKANAEQQKNRTP